MSRVAAFFDVDHTLIKLQSMLSFLEYLYRVTGRKAHHRQILGQLQTLRDSGASREQLNLAFYAILQGESWSDLLLIGQRWYVETRVDDLLMPETRACLEQHRRDGTLIVLVSGSFAPCLDPLAAALQPDAVLCTELSLQDGRLTGQVAKQVIGQGKVIAIRQWMSDKRINLQASHAYGDDISDRPMLELVGHPVVIGQSLELTQLAESKGWRRVHNTGG